MDTTNKLLDVLEQGMYRKHARVVLVTEEISKENVGSHPYTVYNGNTGKRETRYCEKGLIL